MAKGVGFSMGGPVVLLWFNCGTDLLCGDWSLCRRRCHWRDWPTHQKASRRPTETKIRVNRVSGHVVMWSRMWSRMWSHLWFVYFYLVFLSLFVLSVLLVDVCVRPVGLLAALGAGSLGHGEVKGIQGR